MRHPALLLLISLLFAGCATTQSGPNGLADRDPREGLNRGIWEFNEALDAVVFKPAADTYRTVTPRPARRGLSRIFSNLTEPWSFVNNMLQGKPDRAMRNLGRFVVNSTIGVGGLADHATGLGIEPAQEDFGQTLAVWGVGDGGYSVSPLFGPSTSRDTVGTIVGFFANPVALFNGQVLNLSTEETIAIQAADIVQGRATATESGYDAFLDTSADPYAAARSAYFQRLDASLIDAETDGLTVDPDSPESSDDASFEAAVGEVEQQENELTPPASEPQPELEPEE